MATTFKFPTEKKEIAKVIATHIAREESRLSFRRLTWLLAWYYMNGSRRFDVFDPSTGALQAHFLDEEGNLEFQLQEMMNIVDRTIGRLKEISPFPRVERVDHSLKGIRERAMMQVVLDSAVHPQQLENAYAMFLQFFTLLGCAGITGHISKLPAAGLTTDFEVIHPKELFPFPSLGSDYTKIAGMVRQRVLPLDFLKDKVGRKVMDNKDNMEVFTVPLGSQASADENESNEGGGGRIRHNFGRSSGAGGAKQNTIEVVRIRELWLTGSGDRCVRYLMSSGESLLADENHDDEEVYCPIGFHQFIDTGTFHGAGLFDKLFSTVREFERLVKDVINNIREIDRYGVLVLPHGGFQHNAVFKEIGDTLKVCYYEPDVAGQDVRPFMITPFNAGDAPAKVAGMTKSILDNLSPIRDLAEEKGRIDSAAALRVLERDIARPITNATDGIRKAWGEMYRALGGRLLDEMSREPEGIPVGRLTLDLAGVVIDAENNLATFENNPLPTLSRMQFTIKGRQGASDAAKIQGALEVAKNQQTDPMAMKLYFLAEGLEPPMWMEEEKAAYECVIENILTLYADGQRPGEIIFTPHTVRPEMQLRVLGAFMQSTTMKKAGPEVIDVFQDYRESLLMMLQPIMPPGVPEGQDLGMVRDQLPPGQQGGPQQGQANAG